MYKILSYSQEHYEFVADSATDLDRIVAKGKPWAAIGTTCYVIADSTTYVLDSALTWYPLMANGGTNGSTVTDAVRYNTTQNLTADQQATAQANIGIAGATEDTVGLVKGGATTNIAEDGSIEVVKMDISDLTQESNEQVIFSAGGAATY